MAKPGVHAGKLHVGALVFQPLKDALGLDKGIGLTKQEQCWRFPSPEGLVHLPQQCREVELHRHNVGQNELM